MSTIKATDAVERVERVMGLIAGKWKPAIIYALVTGEIGRAHV